MMQWGWYQDFTDTLLDSSILTRAEIISHAQGLGRREIFKAASMVKGRQPGVFTFENRVERIWVEPGEYETEGGETIAFEGYWKTRVEVVGTESAPFPNLKLVGDDGA